MESSKRRFLISLIPLSLEIRKMIFVSKNFWEPNTLNLREHYTVGVGRGGSIIKARL